MSGAGAGAAGSFVATQNKPTMQVILGSGGAIGTPLARALADHTDHVRCCSRTPHDLPTAPDTRYEHYPLDVLDRVALTAACAGAEVVYCCVGLPYDTAVWRRDWPTLADNLIAACAKTGARLAFFDNVYAYAKTSYAHMTEDAPIDPPSAKGKVRAAVLERLWTAHHAGDIRLTVARAADFYGPGEVNGLLNALVFEKLEAGSTPQWLRGNGAGAPLASPDAPHSFTYTPDAGAHFALLANDERAYGESWHLPTASPAETPRQLAARASALYGRPARLRVLPRWLFWALSRVNGQLRELYDVRDQHDGPYVFDSGKFEETFGIRPTPYVDGLRAVKAGR